MSGGAGRRVDSVGRRYSGGRSVGRVGAGGAQAAGMPSYSWEGAGCASGSGGHAQPRSPGHARPQSPKHCAPAVRPGSAGHYGVARPGSPAHNAAPQQYNRARSRDVYGAGQHRHASRGRQQQGKGAQQQQVWSPELFHAELSQAKAEGDDQAVRRALKAVAKSNYDLMQHERGWASDVSRTELVTSRDTKHRLQGFGRDPQYTMSGMPTGDALFHFAARGRPNNTKVCALNFANGEHVGGGYLNGARAQEEELCRQFPCLYTSLRRAMDHGKAYPFGPATLAGHGPQCYADVLYTPRLVGRRGPQAEGYRLLEPRECLDNMALVSAAAPNIPKGEVFDDGLVVEAMRTIVAAPRLKDPHVDTLVLGAWGCGAFGCDPQRVAQLFAHVLQSDGMGRLYREVHFAIPGGNENAQAFERELLRSGIPLKRAASL